MTFVSRTIFVERFGDNVCLLSKNLQDLKQRKKLISSTTFNIKRLVSDNVFYVSLMVLSLKFPRIN